jgi:hypothetical protein
MMRLLMWPKRKRPQERECLPTAFQMTLRKIGLRHVHFAPVRTRMASYGMLRRHVAPISHVSIPVQRQAHPPMVQCSYISARPQRE